MKKTEQKTDDCPYCAEQEHNPENCQWCAEYDAKQTDENDGCPLCVEYDNQDHNQDDCELCQDYNANQALGDTPEQEEIPEEAYSYDDCPECQALIAGGSENNTEPAGELPREQGMETKDELLDAIDQDPGIGQPTPKDIAQQTDDTELPQGLASDDNKSVPDTFGDAQENAEIDQPVEGQDDSSPQLGNVLQDGLNDQADDIQRQKVVDLVGNALQDFKANKGVLEQLKVEQNSFYVANIQMLKAMIELCKMLGLEPKAAQPQAQMQEQVPGQSAQQPAAPQEGAAQDPKTLAG